MDKLKNLLSRAVRCIAFLAALAAVVLFLDKSLMPIQEDNLCPRYFRYPRGAFDVTFLGASQGMYGIYPLELYDEYGMAAYSLSTGNQSLEASYYMAKESIERDRPSLIVLDCSRAFDEEETMEPQYIHYLTDTMPYLNKNRLDMIRNLSKEGEDVMPLLFPLIAFHGRWQELTMEDALPQAKEKAYGARITSRVEASRPFGAPKIRKGAVTDVSRTYIEKTIRLCRDSGTDLLLLTMPVLGKNRFFDQNGYNLRASAAEEVADLAKENGLLHANFLGREEALGFDFETDACDGEHLNRFGAARFTKILGKYIKKHYEIPDRRGEGGPYALLQADLEEYPVNRMRDSLRSALFLRDYAAALRSDAFARQDGELKSGTLLSGPVEDALVLIALNGRVDPDKLTSGDSRLLRSFGLRQDLHEWAGHGYLAVIDAGELVYESSPAPDGGDIIDSFSGEAGRVRYEISSGRLNEETGEILSAASIRAGRLEYAAGGRGLHFAVFCKSTGELLDACSINIFSEAMSCTHDGR